MICPSCGKQVRQSFCVVEKISDTQSHSSGICQYCKEIIHFVSDNIEKITYGWVDSKERKYQKSISTLNKKNQILFVNKKVDRLFKTCLNFKKKFGSNVGFVVSWENKMDVEKIGSAYDIVFLEETLFPVAPSFLAENLIIKSVPAKLFSLEKTLSNKFEVWNG